MGGEGSKKSLFAFFDRNVIERDLKQGYIFISLLESNDEYLREQTHGLNRTRRGSIRCLPGCHLSRSISPRLGQQIIHRKSPLGWTRLDHI